MHIDRNQNAPIPMIPSDAKLKKVPQFLRKFLDQIVQWQIEGRIVAGYGIEITESPVGILIHANANAGGGAAAAEIPKPFSIQVLPVNSALEYPPPPNVGVYYYSKLLQTTAPDSGIAITGLLAADGKGTGFPVVDKDKIWLERDMTETDWTLGWSIEHGKAWDTDDHGKFPQELTVKSKSDDGTPPGYTYTPDKLRILLAYVSAAASDGHDTRPFLLTISDGNDGQLGIMQVVSTNLILQDYDFFTKPYGDSTDPVTINTLAPMPWFGGYTAPVTS